MSKTLPHAGEKLSCLGDSITNGYDGQDHTSQDWSWPAYMTELCGFKEVTNVGKNAATISLNDDGISLVDRCHTIHDQDFITIFGGVNDYDQGLPVGDLQTDDLRTVSGGLKYVIEALARQNPDATMVVFTPMKENKFVPTGTPNAAGLLEIDYVAAIKAVADHYSLPVLDLYASGNIGVFLDPLVGPDGYTADRLHPTPKGYRRLARQIASFINQF
ncbi:SGNH/GDSL hydrolase family protein [Lactiplantibacillus plajomi]|uniref:SGNH/GDSL hydrolase family protein n=1 Tax=Lactiplantibacillus plajomi TaxID=1457217 RepID=A0ABV6K673_9LACO|nr:SGNH/GDSL hydrolase family protein [Lactiplantibacillus plajomi]